MSVHIDLKRGLKNKKNPEGEHQFYKSLTKNMKSKIQVNSLNLSSESG